MTLAEVFDHVVALDGDLGRRSPSQYRRFAEAIDAQMLPGKLIELDPSVVDGQR